MKRSFKIQPAVATIYALLSTACVADSLGSSESADEGAGSTQSPSSESTPVDDAGSGSTSEDAAPMEPFELAAVLACDARQTLSAVQIPHGESPYLESGFRMGNEFPHRFEMDSASPELSAWDGDYYCYDVHVPDAAPEDYDWWFSGNSWLDDDGQIRIYMLTAGIDHVIYYGSEETVGPEPPGAPRTDAIEYDVSTLCPELPRAWIPDPSDHPDRAGRICMHHSTPVAEALFVRVP